MIRRLIFREFYFFAKELRGVLLILFVGLLGPLLTSSIKSSVDFYLQLKSREMLSADLALTSMQRLKAEDVQIVKEKLKPAATADEVEFVSMAVPGVIRGSVSEPFLGTSAARSTLVEIRAIGETYPLVGEFRILRDGKETISRPSELSLEPTAWAFPEVFAQLGLSVGDSIQLGKISFKLIAQVQEAPGISRAGFGLAPRIYIGHKFAEQTGLLNAGSQVFHRLYLNVEMGSDIESLARTVKGSLSEEVFLRTPDDAIQGFDRFARFFQSYLVIIFNVVFALSWMSAFYILQIHLQKRLRDASILMTFGASRVQTAVLYASHVFLLNFIALLGAMTFTFVTTLTVNIVWGHLLPSGFALSLYPRDIGTVSAVMFATSFAFCLPLWLKLRALRLQELLGEGTLSVMHTTWKVTVLSYAPLLLIFLGLSAWLMESWKNSFQVIGGIAAALMISWLVGRFIFASLYKIFQQSPGKWRLVTTVLSRSRFGTHLCFLSLVMVALILSLIPHLLATVKEEIQPSRARELPSLFLFNIPESQAEALKNFSRQNNYSLKFLSPLILARLTKVNDESPKRDPFRRFPVRVSYRENLIPSESIVEGPPLPQPFNPEKQRRVYISVEVNYAERNGFKIGDRLDFDVQGLLVEGEIYNLRKVQWTDFHPNFFMEFQTGLLEEAPKTYIANLNLPGDDNQKAQAQFSLVKNFPDLSVIDVGRTIQKAFDISQSVIGPVQYAAWTGVALSFLILLFVIRHNLEMRTSEVEVQKILGADASLIKSLFVSEYALMTIVAVLLGHLFATGISWFVTTRIFDVTPHWAFFPALLAKFVVIFIVILMTSRAALAILREQGLIALNK